MSREKTSESWDWLAHANFSSSSRTELVEKINRAKRKLKPQRTALPLVFIVGRCYVKQIERIIYLTKVALDSN